MLTTKKKEWFGEWFDSPYYHILYKNRDVEEARYFINQLGNYLHFSPEDHILDLACGKGRHSIYLNSKGLKVTGLDLSARNIEEANRYANENLHFFVHDMRQPWHRSAYDYILNLFTSFGYFDTDQENVMAVAAAAESLKSDGKMVIDFLNPYTVVHNLVPEEIKLIEGIEFHIKKWLSDDNYIVKDIQFTDKGSYYHFQEKVKAIRKKDFKRYFEQAGLEIEKLSGDYDLNDYIPDESDRMIFILKKVVK
ncbi:MAG: class I SAM-dependent methyltransferase [Cyclobacteriaceae bacterium]|nr:class I SAM-dependent methyltransferase [Cyclobacteriaceae bacterium]